MKTLVITGVSRGIGRATTELFLKEGWRVIGLSASGNEPVKHQNLEVHKVDISVSADIERFAKKLLDSSVKIDVLINNAGINIDNSKVISLTSLRKTLEVNLIGLIDLTERLIPAITKGGHIINLSSGLGSLTDTHDANYPAYRISKVAINMYTRTLAHRLEEERITVSSADPGWVKTDMGTEAAPKFPVEAASDLYSLATTKVEPGCFWKEGRRLEW
jgi:NAD(P)-dependent dehydrogenase (short-subunit alcohol dehydrogenase family)